MTSERDEAVRSLDKGWVVYGDRQSRLARAFWSSCIAFAISALLALPVIGPMVQIFHGKKKMIWRLWWMATLAWGSEFPCDRVCIPENRFKGNCTKLRCIG